MFKLPDKVKLPLIATLPVNSCLSFVASPNLVEPDANITDEVINVVYNSVDVILPPTAKLPIIVSFPPTLKSPPTTKFCEIHSEPVTPNPPLICVFTFICKP